MGKHSGDTASQRAKRAVSENVLAENAAAAAAAKAAAAAAPPAAAETTDDDDVQSAAPGAAAPTTTTTGNTPTPTPTSTTTTTTTTATTTGPQQGQGAQQTPAAGPDGLFPSLLGGSAPARPVGAWQSGAPTNQQPKPSDVVKTAVPDAIVTILAAHLGVTEDKCRLAPRLPKKIVEMAGGDFFGTQLRQEFEDVGSALLWAEQFVRAAAARAASMLFARVPGQRPWLFFWGVAAVPRFGPAEGRVATVVAEPPRLDLPPALAAKLAGAALDLHILQGTRRQVELWTEKAVVRGRVAAKQGADGKTIEQEWVEVLAVPKPGWQAHLLGMPAALVQRAAVYRARGATVALPFREFSAEQRFAVAGFLAQQLGGQALLCGFDVRVVLGQAWTTELRDKALALTYGGPGGKKCAARVFTDAPPGGAKAIGAENAAETVEQAAAAVVGESVADRGLVITSARGCNAALWDELVGAIGARKLRCNIAACAVSVPAALAEKLVGKALGEHFFVRAPLGAGLG